MLGTEKQKLINGAELYNGWIHESFTLGIERSSLVFLTFSFVFNDF